MLLCKTSYRERGGCFSPGGDTGSREPTQGEEGGCSQSWSIAAADAA